MPYDFFRQRNRFQNIFDKPRPFKDIGLKSADLSSLESSSDNTDDIVSRMSRLYTPETEATERFNQLMNEIPERTEPGKLRKIFANFVGMGGPSTEAIAYGPYHRALSDWETKLKPAEVGMIQERLRNANERQLVGDIARTEVAGRRADIAQKENERKEREGQERLDIQRNRAEVYKFKAEHGDWKIVAPAGGNITLINPKTGEQKATNIPTGHMTDMDRINLQIEGQKEVARIRGEEARETKKTPSAAQTGKTETELEKSRRIVNKANEVKNQHPEWAKYIKIEGNTVTIAPPGMTRWGLSPEERNKIYREIYGVASPEEVKPAKSHGTETAKAEEPKKKDPLGIR